MLFGEHLSVDAPAMHTLDIDSRGHQPGTAGSLEPLGGRQFNEAILGLLATASPEMSDES